MRYSFHNTSVLTTLGLITLGFLLSVNVGSANNVKRFAGQRTEDLDEAGRVVLAWELNENETEITFELWANTTGFVGFGISPQGGMTGADIFVAGVYPNGTAYSSDRFAPVTGTPQLDAHQDWTLLEATENGTWTFLKFSRLLYTCDEDEDYPITNGTNRLIWALGETDTLAYHGADRRGTRSVGLLAPPSPELDETGLQTWTGVLEMEMPSKDTTYWCSVHKGPPLDKTNYIVGFDAHLPNDLALKHTHHFVLFDCLLPEDGSMDAYFENLTVSSGYKGHACYEGDTTIPIEYCVNQILYTWAKGGKRSVFPEDVAYPLGGNDGANKTKYFLMEVHYDNPEMAENATFATGVEIFYTDTPRAQEAGQLVISHDIGSTVLTIPPNTPEFSVTGHCSADCTSDKLQSEGISIFNVLLHSHISGRKLKFRHFRNGLELPWIAYDDHYDFDYQQNKHLGEVVRVLPGDQLAIECTYDSTWNEGRVVTGGLSSRNEMCQVFVWYYPKLDDLIYCESAYGLNDSLTDFNITKWTVTGTGPTPIYNIEEPEYLRGEFESSISYNFTWTEEFKRQLEDKRRFADHTVICGVSRSHMDGITVSYPKEYVEFVPEEFCSSGSE